MKKQWLISILLITLDQIIKIFIWNNAMDIRITLIPLVFRFEPYQNTNLNWFASMLDVVAPVFIMIILQLIVAVGITLFYMYQKQASVNGNLWLNLGYSMMLAGVLCSFIDVSFWGGSLDYIGLFDWFIFDMKDVFLNIGWISIIIWFLSKEYKSNKDNLIPFKLWVENGFKLTKKK